MRRLTSILFLFIISGLELVVLGQDIDMFRTVYSPSEPCGGSTELQSFVKQEVVYPRSLLASETAGSVFITYLIDNEGRVAYKEVVDYGEVELRREAERIFDKILWVADDSRLVSELSYEKIKFNFHPKKYKKLVKRRGYDLLPFQQQAVDSSSNFFSINQLDEEPSTLNAESINDFILQNFNYPPIALKMNISGRVTVEFIVEPYGKLSNFNIIEAVGGGCNEETIRLLKAMDWKSGIKDGKAVRTLFEYQLNFVHPGGTIR